MKKSTKQHTKTFYHSVAIYCPVCREAFIKEMVTIECEVAPAPTIEMIRDKASFYAASHYNEHFQNAKEELIKKLRPTEDFMAPNDDMGGITENEI